MASNPIPDDRLPPPTLDEGAPLSVAEYERLPEDGYRHELVRGRLVREPQPGAEHGGTGADLASELSRHVRAGGFGRVLVQSGFLLSEDPPTVRAPDVAFIAAARIPATGLPVRWFPGPPDLAVEVVSPSNTPAGMRAKVRDWLEPGARQVWVVEPRTRRVVVHGPGDEARVLREDDVLDGGELLPGWRARVAALFG